MKQRRYRTAVGAGVVAVGLIGVLVGALSPDVAQMVGRFHPVVVHLPIGLLLLAGLLEGLGRLPGWGHLRAGVPFVLVLGTLSALAAVASGWLLAEGGGYDEGLLYWHRRLGIAVVVVALAALLLHRLVQRRASKLGVRAYAGALAVMTVLVIGAGHFGGSLTHGSTYLTDYLPDVLRVAMALPPRDAGPAPVVDIEEAVIFSDLVQPVLRARCVDCHGPEKTRGDLRLDDLEGLMAGGEDGPVVVPGDAAASELVRRILLPPGHDDHMPPEGRPPLTVAEAELLRWWIDQGAPAELTVAEATPTPGVEVILDSYAQGEARTGVFALEIPEADPEAIEAARAAGLDVMPLAQGETLLQVHVSGEADTVTAAHLQLLEPLARQVTWLDLGRTAVTDEALAALAGFEHLTRLHLERTPVTDRGLAHLRALPYLEYLNLYGTGVTDAGLQQLSGLPALRQLYLWQTAVTDGGIRRLQEALPELTIHGGLAPEAIPSAPEAADTTSAYPAAAP